MAKGLCPGVGQSQEKESVEKAGRERGRERPIFLVVHRKPIKPLHRTCTAHEGTGRSLKEPGQESKLGRLPLSEELAVEKEKEPQPPGFRHQKCKVRS